jgi:hypothetical protein
MPTADGMRLEWAPPRSDAEDAYNVYRALAAEPWPEQPLNSEPLSAAEYLDTKVVTGERYSYTIRVVLETGAPSREGESGVVRGVLAEDRFPPAPPDGLVAVQEGMAVRLFWNPNAERDLAGYRIDRRVEGENWRHIGPERVDQSSFLDPDVRVGQRLAYRVSALDRVDPPNESAPSAAVDLEVVEEPVAP